MFSGENRPDARGLKRLVGLVRQVGVKAGDTQETRLEKSILIAASMLVAAAATLWGLFFTFYAEYLAAAISFCYAGFSLTSLFVLANTQRHRPFLFWQLFLGLVLPFTHMLILGGFWESGGILIWSLISPMGAFLFYPYRSARYWWLAYLGLLIASAFLQPLLTHTNHFPAPVRTVLLVMNLGVVSSIVLVLLRYFVGEKNRAYELLRLEEEKSDQLLRNVLPREIAERLKEKPQVIAEAFEEASILFADLAGFTTLSVEMAPVVMVNLLNEVFSQFDSLVEKYAVEKIRTIGDNYMVVAGVPLPMPDHAQRLALMALDMRRYLQSYATPDGTPIRFRIGINSGPVIGGVIGHKKFVYDVWGDAVNIASRMESQGIPGKIQITQETYERIKDEFHCEPRGAVEVKGRGEIHTWFLEGNQT